MTICPDAALPGQPTGGTAICSVHLCLETEYNIVKILNDDVFVTKGYEHIWASSGHRLNWAFCGCLIDVEARAYVRTASYAPAYNRVTHITHNMALAEKLVLKIVH